MTNYTIEAEDMSLNGYSVQTNSGDASGGSYIQASGEGSASTVFTGEAGTYTLDLTGFDENDGSSIIDIKVNGVVVATVVFDEDNGGNYIHGTLETFSFANIELAPGDVIEINGQQASGEFARIDKIDLTLAEAAPIVELGDSVVLLNETFDGPVDTVESSDFDIDVHYGDALTSGGYDGDLVFDTVNIEDLTNATVKVDLSILSGGFEELGTQYGDYLSIELIDQNGTIHVLDVFSGSGHTLSGSQTGQSFSSGNWSTLEWDVPAGVTSFQISIQSDISSHCEQILIDNVVVHANEIVVTPPILDAVDDVYTVSESEGAGDVEGNVTDNDINEFDNTTTVVKVNGIEGSVGEWIELEKGRVKIEADGSIDFDANGDFDDLNTGDSEEVNLTYTIAEVVEGTPEYQCLFFNHLGTGEIVTDQFAANGLTISSANAGNPVMIFDTANVTGGDTDLATGNLGKVLILSEDGNSANPDDNAGGGTFIFDFDGVAEVESITFLDTEEPGAEIRFYNSEGTLISTVAGPVTPDGGQATASFNVEGVARMEIQLQGSGAIDNLIYNISSEPEIIDQDTANVKIIVEGEGAPANLPPVAEDDAFMLFENDANVVGNILDNDSDPDMDPISVVGIEGGELNSPIFITTAKGNTGFVTVQADGSFEFTPDDNFTSLAQDETDSFTLDYTISDDPTATAKTNILFVLDVSNSTVGQTGNDQDNFDGVGVGDVNGDGLSDTVLDAQIQAVISSVNRLLSDGVDPSTVDIGLVTFSGIVDLTRFTAPFNTPTEDATDLGEFALDEAALIAEVQGILSGGWTNYEAGLQAAEGWLANNSESGDQNKVIFLSDGRPIIDFQNGEFVSQSTDDYGDEITRLVNDYDASIAAIGVGANSSLDALNDLDNTDGAEQVLDVNALVLAVEDAVVTPLTDTATITVTINGLGAPANLPPVAEDDAFMLFENDANVVGNILDNDSDPDMDPISVVGIEGGELNSPIFITTAKGNTGFVTVQADGSFEFTPDDNFTSLAQDETDSFTLDYTISDDPTATAKTNILFVLDISNSTVGQTGDDQDNFDGVGVGDVNGDGLSDTVLDAQIQAVISSVNRLLSDGVDPSTVDIGLVTFSGIVDLTRFTAPFNTPTEDATDLGEFALDEAALIAEVQGILSGGWTNYEAGLQAAEGWLANNSESGDQNKVVFLSDGRPIIDFQNGEFVSQSTDDYGDEITRLVNDYDASIAAIGVGGNSSLDALNDLDNTDGAEQVLDVNALVLAVEDAVVTPLTDTATITVTINGLNANPTAVRNDYGVLEGAGPVTIGNVLTDEGGTAADPADRVDSDPDAGDILSVTKFTFVDGSGADVEVDAGGSAVITNANGRSATVSIDTDGAITFEASSDFDDLNDGESDTIDLTYTIEDDQGGAPSTAEVSITVDGVGQQAPQVQYNVVFLVDNSTSTGTGIEDGHPLFGDLPNGDPSPFNNNLDGVGPAGTTLDAELATVQAVLDKFQTIVPGADLDFGIYGFGNSIGDYADAPAILEGSLDGLAADGTLLESSFSGVTTAGVAAFNVGFAAANTFLADQNANGMAGYEQVNLVYLLTDQFGLDTGNFGPFQNEVNVANELRELVEDNGAVVDTLIFKPENDIFDPNDSLLTPIELVESSVEVAELDGAGNPTGGTRTVQIGDGVTNEILSADQLLNTFLPSLEEDLGLV